MSTGYGTGDHGTETGWSSSYGDGQAVFAENITFYKGYYVIDGNGTHTIPSKNSSDYGFKIVNTQDANYGVITFGEWQETASNIIIKYVHAYNTYGSKIKDKWDPNGDYPTLSIRFYPGSVQNHIKVQNCFLENSGQDGIQISVSSYLLFERNYIYGLGLLYSYHDPDHHGQTVQIFYGGDNIIFRNNIWEANEGQGLIALGSSAVNENIRFYGNVVFNGYGQQGVAGGFNSSGGIIGDAWPEEWKAGTQVNGMYVYNNTIVNTGGDYDRYSDISSTRFIMQTGSSNDYTYNNLFYNAHRIEHWNWTGAGYHASGGGDTACSADTICASTGQIGLLSSIFQNYTTNNFRLTSPTQSGLTLTSQPWWSGGTDAFFGSLDSAVDMYGNTRGVDGNWERGAYEYTGSTPPLTYCGDSSCNGTETCSTCPSDCGACPTNSPDLIVTDISWSPANPQTGNAVTFSATIKNQGTGPTPAGIIHGVLFTVDSQTYVWSDSYTNSLAPGASVTVTASGGPTGTATWTATAGTHSVLANVDDINRIGESNENNNTLTETLTLGTTDTTPPSPPTNVVVS
ncbi:MAG: hypothetical protein A2172_02775 [Candidatus Woykebacteria bacterium RBG_13_40_15]|uniref:Uncharacterized protein n=1 Tax=Candidatus Woykebacteria bacterium RBG_13_40_15 TaxID=1802593 RepID=A0A1G1W8H3_9BACT|nr:MAG: hypothetical protein A2172_02775 [Candidatus Woykebacteria bacterium RBG_13_40_15]